MTDKWHLGYVPPCHFILELGVRTLRDLKRVPLPIISILNTMYALT